MIGNRCSRAYASIRSSSGSRGGTSASRYAPTCGAMRSMSVGGGLVAPGQPLPHLLDVALEHEQPIGVAGRIGEVVRLAVAQLHAQVLLEIVDVDRFHVAKRHPE